MKVMIRVESLKMDEDKLIKSYIEKIEDLGFKVTEDFGNYYVDVTIKGLYEIAKLGKYKASVFIGDGYLGPYISFDER